MKNRDLNFLKVLSKDVILNLKERNISYPFKFSRNKLKTWKTATDGWGITIGNLYGYKCSIQIWIDKFTGHPSRKLWYCVSSRCKNNKFKTVAKSATKIFGKHFDINFNDLDKNNEIFVLSKKLNKAKFGRPILENYPQQNYIYYGIYELDQTGLEKDRLQRLVLRVADFVCDLIESLNETSLKQLEDYPGIENRKLVISHIARERRSHIATLRKQKDDYKCTICELKFKEKYGNLGKGNTFAEAHHIIPLSSSNKIRLTKIEDLITVCANCHRMLHRMSGKKSDIPRLKNIVRKLKHNNR